MKRVIKVGIMPREEFRKRTIAIAKGEYKPGKGEPKVWFESIKSMSQILSSENQELLRIIVEKEPKSLKELSEASGRKPGNLSRTLKTMSSYGIIEIKKNKEVIPVVKATDFLVEFGLNSSVGFKRDAVTAS